MGKMSLIFFITKCQHYKNMQIAKRPKVTFVERKKPRKK